MQISEFEADDCPYTPTLDKLAGLSVAERSDELEKLEAQVGPYRDFSDNQVEVITSFCLLDEPERQWQGKEIGNWQLKSLIGRGGFGAVFKARHREKPGPWRAVKILHGPMEEDSRQLVGLAGFASVRGNWDNELQNLIKIDGESPVTLIDADIHTEELDGVTRRYPYLVMKYIDFPATLTEYARREEMGREARLRTFIKVCEDIAEIYHRTDVYHLDLKPENILVGIDHKPYVIDFGLARVFDASQDPSEVSSYGTREYRSPEQAEGGKLGPWSDVYALGVVLIELLTGDRPWVPIDANKETIRQALSDHIANNPESLIDSDDPVLEPIARALIPHVPQGCGEDRYGNVGPFVQAVKDACQSDRLPVAKPATAWLSRRKLTVMLCIVGLVVLYGLWRHVEARVQVDRLSKVLPAARPEVRRAINDARKANGDELTMLAYCLLLADADGKIFAGDLETAYEHLQRLELPEYQFIDSHQEVSVACLRHVADVLRGVVWTSYAESFDRRVDQQQATECFERAISLHRQAIEGFAEFSFPPSSNGPDPEQALVDFLDEWAQSELGYTYDQNGALSEALQQDARLVHLALDDIEKRDSRFDVITVRRGLIAAQNGSRLFDRYDMTEAALAWAEHAVDFGEKVESISAKKKHAFASAVTLQARLIRDRAQSPQDSRDARKKFDRAIKTFDLLKDERLETSDEQAFRDDCIERLALAKLGLGRTLRTVEAEEAIETIDAVAKEVHKRAESEQNVGQQTRWNNSLAFALTYLGSIQLSQQASEAAEEHFREAIAIRQKFVTPLLNSRSLTRSQEQILRQHAWLLANCEVEELRRPKEALELAKRVKQLGRQEAFNLRLLGVAYYRCNELPSAERYLQQAVEAFDEQVLSLQAAASEVAVSDDTDLPCDIRSHFFLAMTLAEQKDRTAEARRHYAQAETARQRYRAGLNELQRIRDEANRVLQAAEADSDQ